MAAAIAIPRELKPESGLVKSSYDNFEITEDYSVPIIDFSLLTSSNPEERSKAITELGMACEKWGFFLLINHGVPESLRKSILEWLEQLFNMPKEELGKLGGNHVMDPVRCGARYFRNRSGEPTEMGYIKLIVHPEFSCPDKPADYRDSVFEYCKRVREIIAELLKGVSESLGLEPDYISKATDLDSGFQRFVSQCYPPCPKPELAHGITPHSDHSLMTIVTDNGINGTQTVHNGKWVNPCPPSGALMVNTCDQLEILTNGKYRSNIHRGFQVANTKRISVVSTVGPSLDKIIVPAPGLLDESHPPAYVGLTMREYYELHQSGNPAGKAMLDLVRIAKKETA
ncbi:hypothetical protein L6164_033407 [Bauhinia variegata]|uniref:Uncharacterized protein n=1 Tax=Bauhinia variegata TaxID=167791 RepID=A0ACB9KRU0_BAUVA|nr:hypothetical protein L6164_033407 [Bauhinia variegata]